MGVTGLWTVVSPTARPTQLATLNRKRLAVDASIWIYQFLKAVRDKEGNALRNSHVVGFFRRICKLLYFGVRPVFVFDGGAPALKRETVRGRRTRREGRREDAVRTAGRLLGLQMRRVAEEEDRERKRRGAKRVREGEEGGKEGVAEDVAEEEEELPPQEEMVYVDEMGMSQSERQTNRRQNQAFKKKDQYHLPDLDISIDSMGAPNDPRIMSQAELEEYARQFHRGEDINLYDFSKIDFEGAFFLSLPPSDRYNILNAARLRSRLRMGYSKEQLDGMFPDRMAFSRFQIERVRERNELTQRLMHVNGMADDFRHQGGRVAGEKGKEYVLVRNEGVEGGWALGVVSNKGGNEGDAIDLDAESKGGGDEGGNIQEEEEEEEEDEGGEDFEDVAIEGLNRLPRKWARKRRDVDYNPDYREAADEIAEKRRAVYEARRRAATGTPVQRPGQPLQPESDDLFVAQDHDNTEGDEGGDDLFEDVDMNLPATDEQAEQADLQRAIQMSLQPADLTEDAAKNNRSRADSDGEEDDFDLQAALAESRKSKHKSSDCYHPAVGTPLASSKQARPEKRFSGPLPFESLNLGQSLLGKKKADRIQQDQAGGFERETDRRKAETAPLPSWFEAKDWSEVKKTKQGDRGGRGGGERNGMDRVAYPPREERAGSSPQALMKDTSRDVIDVEEPSPSGSPEQIEIESSEDESVAEGGSDVRNVVDQAEPLAPPSTTDPTVDHGLDSSPILPIRPSTDHLSSRPSNGMKGTEDIQPNGEWAPAQNIVLGSETTVDGKSATTAEDENEEEEEEEIFEDVALGPAPERLLQYGVTVESGTVDDPDGMEEADEENDRGDFPDRGEAEDGEEEEGYMSESDEELMRQMATEAEEHARFTSSINDNNTGAAAATTATSASREPPLDFEKELKQLRHQQRRDRRDADEVSQTMVQECQALLRLFGLPYMTAPQEAEAQCAELVRLNLVDGVVTDDSDIFLFGGTRVYKNMFNAARFVECYLASDLEAEYGLDRARLIRLAHLLGSDYTDGVAGVGPVTALEILTDFDHLDAFRDWCWAVQMDGTPLNHNKKKNNNDNDDIDDDTETQTATATSAFRKKFTKQAQKLLLPPSFPDNRVDQAYLHPEVDSDRTGFEWGVPDLDALRSFLMATIGWSQERTDEVLVPVIRDMNKRAVEGTQSNLTRFFGGVVGVGAAAATASASASAGGGGRRGEARAPTVRKKSGRMEKAFGRLRGRVAEGRERERQREREGGKRKRVDDDDDEQQQQEEEEEVEQQRR